MIRNKTQLHTASQSGFTVIELMVVFLIMTTISALVLIGWNQQRPNRLMTIAQNELITNIRKMQSYAISSRNISANVAPRYYIMRMVENDSFYTISAIGTDYTFYPNVETITFAQEIYFSDFWFRSTGSNTNSYPNCVQIIISSPYGKMYFDTTSPCNSSDVATQVQNLPALAAMTDKDLDIFFEHSKTPGNGKGVSVHGLTGGVETY